MRGVCRPRLKHGPRRASVPGAGAPDLPGWKQREPGVQRGSWHVLRLGSSSRALGSLCGAVWGGRSLTEPRMGVGEHSGPAPPTFTSPGPRGHPAHPAPSTKGREHVEFGGWAQGCQSVGESRGQTRGTLDKHPLNSSKHSHLRDGSKPLQIPFP